MRRILCPQLPKANRPAILSESEAKHATQVLRLADGDTVEALDGKGLSTPAIIRTHSGPIRLELPSSSTIPPARTAAASSVLPIVLEMGVLKGDAMEWVVEKCVELGISRLTPVITDHTVVQMKNKGPEAFKERWEKIADQALKQCGRLHKMEIDLPTPLKELATQEKATLTRFFCDEAAESTTPSLTAALHHLEKAQSEPSSKTLHLLIGPEGGWSKNERELLSQTAQKVTLGPLVLRAETAALFGLSVLSAALRERQNLTLTQPS